VVSAGRLAAPVGTAVASPAVRIVRTPPDEQGPEVRCPGCRRLLLRGEPRGRFVVACGKCRRAVQVAG